MLSDRSVAIVGMGHAGSRYAARLISAGWSVTLWDRDLRASQRAGAADIVLLSIAGGAAVRDVARHRALIAAMRRGAVLVDMSTISPELSRALAAEAAVRDVQMLDVAASGSTAQAEAGELVILVGGDEAVVE